MSDTPTTVQCVTTGKEQPAISGRIPFREPLRSQIRQSVGAPAWALWLDQQVKIINEYRLNLAEPRSRELLEEQAKAFLKLDGGAGAQAEVGPDKARELGNL